MPDFAGEAERSRAAKNALRSCLLAVRRSKTTADRLEADASLQATLLSWIRTRHVSTMAAYAPIGTEPGGADLPDVLMNALPPAGRLLLPVLLDDGDLDWVRYSGRLVPGPRGLGQPDGVRLGVDAVRDASLSLVPPLAVSSAGIRLGRGGGSYDRVLSRLAAAPPPASPAVAKPQPLSPARDVPMSAPPPAGASPPSASHSSIPAARVDDVLIVALLY